MAELKKTITVPKVAARLKPYIEIYGQVYDGTKPISQIEIPSNLKRLGTVRKVEYTNDRGDIKYYTNS